MRFKKHDSAVVCCFFLKFIESSIISTEEEVKLKLKIV